MSVLTKDRVRPGLYRHHAGGDSYVVIAVSVMDEHGHGNVEAPRIVTYHSTRSFETELSNSHTEEDFVRPTVCADGVTRPRFERIEYEAPYAKEIHAAHVLGTCIACGYGPGKALTPAAFCKGCHGHGVPNPEIAARLLATVRGRAL